LTKARKKQTPRGQTARNRALLSVDPGFTIRTHRALLGLSFLSLVLLSVIFEPIGWWPVAFVCLVPWVIMVGAASHAPRVYLHSWLLGLAFFFLNMHWLYYATGAGYAALSVYQSLYFPFLACVLRHVVRRRHWPLAIALPIVWTGGEMLRAVVASGFPWFFISHALHRPLVLIQISDLVGAYGVTFVAAAINGAIADVVLHVIASRRAGRESAPKRGYALSVGFASTLLVFTLGYGVYQLNRSTMSDGPRIALIQGDYVMDVYDEEAGDPEKFQTYMAMIDAAAKEHPDLFLLPETPWRMFLNDEARQHYSNSRYSYQAMQSRADKYHAYIVVGSASEERNEFDLLAPVRRYSSADVIKPGGTGVVRYDKVHLVYFGEIVPFRFGRLRFLYLWMNSIMPFSEGGKYEYSLFPGKTFHHFEMTPKSQPGRTYRFATPICYEDVMPYVSRRFVNGGAKGKQVDFLLNISNDGWFGRGNQQPQHLAISQYRAVENRVGVARSVNTGMSALIDPDGRVSHVVKADTSNPWPRANNFEVGTIKVDSRYSLYTRYGDWFSWACVVATLVVFLDYWITRARTRGLSLENDERASKGRSNDA